jgi:DNA-binding NarL/FixJ family response regulator
MLTAREIDMLRLLTAGATNREIARRLTLGDETVKTHVSRVLRKLDVRTRTAAAAKARELGITADPIQ